MEISHGLYLSSLVGFHESQCFRAALADIQVFWTSCRSTCFVLERHVQAQHTYVMDRTTVPRSGLSHAECEHYNNDSLLAQQTPRTTRG